MSLSKVKLYRNKIVIYYKKGESFLRYDTEVKINNKLDFSEKQGGLKKSVNNSFEINSRIRNLQKKIDGIIEKKIEDPSVEINLKYVKDELNKSQKFNNYILKEFFMDFISVKQKELKDKSPTSLKDYQTIYNSIDDFEYTMKKTFLIKDINKGFVNDYTDYLKQERIVSVKTKKGIKRVSRGGLNDNTIKKRLVLMYSFFKYLGKEYQVKISPEIYEVEKDISPQSVYNEVLTREEVKIVRDFNLDDKLDRKVRDIFVFSCMTGLRWGDLQLIDKNDIQSSNGIRYIDMKTKKTTKDVVIPLNKTSFDIIERYNYSLKSISNQKFNDRLKIIFKKIDGFNKNSKKKNDKTNKNYKRWELISIHKGRHTFITNLITSTTPVNVIMRYTGHTKLETLLKYINMNVKIDDTYVNQLE